MTSSGTLVYLAGGYSFSAAGGVNAFRSYNPVTNTWMTLTGPGCHGVRVVCGLFADKQQGLCGWRGGRGYRKVSNATRIYDVASNTWSAGAAMPDFRAFMASGYFAGKIYLVGGYNTGNVRSFGQVWNLSITNTFNTTSLNMPATLGRPGMALSMATYT